MHISSVAGGSSSGGAAPAPPTSPIPLKPAIFKDSRCICNKYLTLAMRERWCVTSCEPGHLTVQGFRGGTQRTEATASVGRYV